MKRVLWYITYPVPLVVVLVGLAVDKLLSVVLAYKAWCFRGKK